MSVSAPAGQPPVELPPGASLFLDFDGTLVEIAERPDAVHVSDAVVRLLPALADALDGRLAIVSGRPADSIAALLGVGRWAVAGSHGAELRWPDGRVTAPPVAEWIDPAAVRAETLRREHPGIVIERKPFGLALHYRLAPEAEQAVRTLAADIAGDRLAVQPGKMVVELRAPGRDKGDAVRRFMAEPAMIGTAPWFVGDDLTDEAGFRAAAELGGAGILVGPPRETAARYRLEDVAAVIGWLAMAARLPA